MDKLRRFNQLLWRIISISSRWLEKRKLSMCYKVPIDSNKVQERSLYKFGPFEDCLGTDEWKMSINEPPDLQIYMIFIGGHHCNLNINITSCRHHGRGQAVYPSVLIENSFALRGTFPSFSIQLWRHSKLYKFPIFICFSFISIWFSSAENVPQILRYCLPGAPGDFY